MAGIAYADGEYVVILECDEVQEDGTCHPDKTVVEVYSRKSLPLSQADIDRLTPVAESLCMDKSDFHLVSHDSKCNYPVDLLAVQRKCLETDKKFLNFLSVDCPLDHTPEFKCSLENIPSAEDFDADQVCLFKINVVIDLAKLMTELIFMD